MDQITVSEAAEEKGCTPQAIRDACKKGLFDYQAFGRTFAINANKKYKDWQPSGRQRSGKAAFGK